MKHKKIFLTGGGTAGHVTPNIALIESLKAKGWQIEYVGAANSIEEKLTKPLGLPFHKIKVGKLRRYFSWQNFIDPFKLVAGVSQSYYLCLTKKPDVVFSKGGFVSLPLVVGAWLNRIPVILHESDTSPGLANKLSLPFVKQACITFPETQKYFKKVSKITLTGSPIRASLLKGTKDAGLAFTGLKADKPIILIICGTVGSTKVNQTIRKQLEKLLKHYSIIHICGKNDIKKALKHHENYKQYEYIDEELKDVFACSDLIISRSGANSLSEIQALKKPSILIPIPKTVSRGEQSTNAMTAKKSGFSEVIEEAQLNPTSLYECIEKMFKNHKQYQEKLNALETKDSVKCIVDLINLQKTK
jgi:UDP-N-acetylglucosamine--N-acetylmuramyl-(pentapeptide) pyrophosphoryl-undecaprenol N-acetylglucosamine transferase